MANVFIQDSTMSAIGEAIREKTGGVALIYPKDMAAQISSIKTGAVLQEKTVTPTTSQQEVTPDADYDGLSKVTVEAMQVSNTASPVIEVSDAGLIQASVQYSEGYITEDTKKTAAKQLPIKAGERVIPSTADKVAIEAGVFTTWPVTVAGDANLVPENIKSGVSIFGVDGTHEGGIDVTLIEGMEIPLDFSAGDQALAAPEGYAVKSATIKKPTTLIPQNIAKGVNIAGVVGTLESGGGGESTDLVKYVTFLNEDGTTLYQMPVLVGDDCKDPVTHGDISTPTKESTNTEVFTHSGWTSTVGGTADSSILKNITEDKTVYAAYTASVRYYTVTFYDGETLLESVQVAYGGTATPTEIPIKDGSTLSGWNPSPTNVTADVECYAVWEESSFYNASWESVIYACQSNNVPSDWNVGDSKEMIIDGTSYTIDIIGKNHDTYADGGAAPLTFQLHDCLDTTYQMNTTATNVGGYDSTAMHTTHLPAIKALMPTEVQAAIKSVGKKTMTNAASWAYETVNCDLFLLSKKEVLDSGPTEGSQYAYYAEGNSAVKTTVSGSKVSWWLRSPSTINGETTTFNNIDTSGAANVFESKANVSLYVSFGFCF